MIIAVASCWNYRDAWKPFFALLDHFWPAHPQAYLITDTADGYQPPPNVNVFVTNGSGLWTWGPRLAEFTSQHGDTPILLMQEDFLLNAVVNTRLMDHAVEQMHSRGAGSVRVYPCPGADQNYGDAHIGIVCRGSRYRVSCQATIFRPKFLHVLTSQFQTPTAFELQGSLYADTYLDAEVLATKRESKPWPLSYICTAIVRGKWLPEAKTLCDEHSIHVDWTMRPFAA